MKKNNSIEQNPKLKIVVPNKGRLYESSISILKNIGLDFEIDDRKLSSSVSNFDIEIIYASASNIPEYVQDGIVDMGITGLDLVNEKSAKVIIVEKLHYGKTRLTIAVPEESHFKTINDLEDKRIATCFPNLTKKYFNQKGIRAEIVEVDGAVEITPVLGLVDAISDLSSSGSSLRINKLRAVDIVLDSEAVLIENKNLSLEKQKKIEVLKIRIQSVLNAQRKKYIMLNAHENILEKIKMVAPGLSSPTIMRLSESGMIAVHSVIDASDTWRIVEELKKIGASGILIIPLEKMVI